MKLAIFSDTRQPTKADGGHGLGMSAHSIASGLAARGHDVTLCAGHGSEFGNGRLQMFSSESEIANWYLNNVYLNREVGSYPVLDTSHFHQLSKFAPHAPVVNRVADLECTYQPPNVVVNRWYMVERYPNASLVNTGIIDPGAFRYNHDGYLLFAGRQEPQLGWHLVQDLAKQSDMPLRVASGLSGDDKWHLFAGAAVLIHPSQNRAAPRLPVEAGYCGVPTVCLSGDGAEHVVMDGLTGYVAQNALELAQMVNLAMSLDRSKIYDWMKTNHDYDVMINAYERLLLEVADKPLLGGKWKQHLETS